MNRRFIHILLKSAVLFLWVVMFEAMGAQMVDEQAEETQIPVTEHQADVLKEVPDQQGGDSAMQGMEGGTVDPEDQAVPISPHQAEALEEVPDDEASSEMPTQ